MSSHPDEDVTPLQHREQQNKNSTKCKCDAEKQRRAKQAYAGGMLERGHATPGHLLRSSLHRTRATTQGGGGGTRVPDSRLARLRRRCCAWPGSAVRGGWRGRPEG